MSLVFTKMRALQDERALLVKEIRDILSEQMSLHERKLEKMDALAKVEGELKLIAAERNPA